MYSADQNNGQESTYKHTNINKYRERERRGNDIEKPCVSGKT